jgi:hypothetical protein
LQLLLLLFFLCMHMVFLEEIKTQLGIDVLVWRLMKAEG